VGATGDEGEEALGRGGAPGDLLDNTGEAKLLIRGEKRRLSAEGVGKELEPLDPRLRVRETPDDVGLGTEVDLGRVDDVTVDASFLTEVDVGALPTAAEEEVHGDSNAPYDMNMLLELPLLQLEAPN
jgi:hypothetical protein